MNFELLLSGGAVPVAVYERIPSAKYYLDKLESVDEAPNCISEYVVTRTDGTNQRFV